MPRPACEFEPPPFHPRRPGLVRPVRIDPAGLVGPTRAQTQGAGWRRTSRGLYLPVRCPADSVEQVLVEVAASLPRHSSLTGWAALHWLHAPWSDGGRADGSRRPVPVLVGNHRMTARPELLISSEGHRPADVREIDGLPITSPVWAVAFEARRAATLEAAVRWLDIGYAADLVDPVSLGVMAWRLTATTGVGRLREAMAYANENSWSPQETTMRLLWVRELGISPVVANHPVFDLSGRFVATPDLLDLSGGVAGEYDGRLHLQGRQRARDITREGALRAVGLEYVTMTAADLADPSDFLRRTRQARERAAHLPRRWTIESPEGWVDTTTVAARRGLTTSQRGRLLRRQAG